MLLSHQALGPTHIKHECGCLPEQLHKVAGTPTNPEASACHNANLEMDLSCILNAERAGQFPQVAPPGRRVRIDELDAAPPCHAPINVKLAENVVTINDDGRIPAGTCPYFDLQAAQKHCIS